MTIVFLFGGKGTRVSHLSDGKNKCLIQINKKTVCEYLIENAINTHLFSNFIFITNKEDKNELSLIIRKFNIKYKILIQDSPEGIPHALNLAKNEVSSRFCLHLGDFLSYELKNAILGVKEGNVIFLNKVDFPEKYGILSNEGKIIEKPNKYIGDMAVRGLYIFEKNVFELIPSLIKSKRNEYEIVDLLNKIKFNTFELKECFDLGSEKGLKEFFISKKILSLIKS